ncbi:hypothetical protein [Streptomyces sp. NBC_01304]|uniref:hypothetical protein n=1 Tax=Streptomyces sp. NBC_01304 TaxID=2903818 RepID=UPI002E0DF789|nr:3'-5' exoribonuclease [Streptomyces sp. NBC_01304]
MSRRIYLDAEFVPHDSSNRGLVSIALVDDSGREYYAINADHDYAAVQAHEFLREHVWPTLPRTEALDLDRAHPSVKPLGQIRTELADFFDGPERAELYAWYGIQDHYRLMGLWEHDWQAMPRSVPRIFHELRALADAAGLEELPEPDGVVHHALADAHYARTLHRHITSMTTSSALGSLEDAAELARYRTANDRGALFRFDGPVTVDELFAGELELLRGLVASVRVSAQGDCLSEIVRQLKWHDVQVDAALAEQQRRDGCTGRDRCTCSWCVVDEADQVVELARAAHSVPYPVVRPTGYAVCILPDDSPNARLYTLNVIELGNDQWAVRHLEAYLSPDGTWDDSPMPHDEGWMTSHSWDRSTALAFARLAAVSVPVNGIPALSVLRRATSEMRGARNDG